MIKKGLVKWAKSSEKGMKEEFLASISKSQPPTKIAGSKSQQAIECALT